MIYLFIHLEDSSDTEAELKSTSPTVVEASSVDSSSSDETDLAGEKLEALERAHSQVHGGAPDGTVQLLGLGKAILCALGRTVSPGPW